METNTELKKVSKVLFEGKAKVGKSWAGTQIQIKTYKDKFGIVKRGESRSCPISTKWGTLQIPNYKDMNKYGNKEIKITLEIINKKAKK